MFKPFALAAAIAGLTLNPAMAAAASPAALPDLDSQIECSVVFAMVAGMQDEKDPNFDHFPLMDAPGMAFFEATLGRVMKERGYSQDKAFDYMMTKGRDAVSKFTSSSDPVAMVDERMDACLPMFDVIAPEAAPKPRD